VDEKTKNIILGDISYKGRVNNERHRSSVWNLMWARD
jgi:hypothetical protein